MGERLILSYAAVALFTIAGCSKTPGEQNDSGGDVATTALPNGTNPQTITAATPSSPLPVEESTRLLAAAVTPQECPTSWNASGDSTSDPAAAKVSDAVNSWIETNIVHGGGLTVTKDQTLTRGGPPTGRKIDFLESDGNKVTYYREILGGGNQDLHVTQLLFNACRPAGVNVLDTTVSANGKDAEVIYTINYKISALAEKLLASELPRPQVMLPQVTQRRAVLHRLDALGWQVQQI